MVESRKKYNDGRGSGGSGTGRYGRGRGHRGGERGGNYQNYYVRQGGESYQGGGGRVRGGIPMDVGYENHVNEYGARGRGSGGHRGGGGRDHNYEIWYVQCPGGRAEHYQGGGRGRGHDGYNNQPPVRGSHDGGPNHTVPQQQLPPQYHLSGAVEPAGKGAWTGRPWGRRFPSSPSSSTAQPLPVSLPQSQTQRAPESSPAILLFVV